MELALWS